MRVRSSAIIVVLLVVGAGAVAGCGSSASSSSSSATTTSSSSSFSSATASGRSPRVAVPFGRRLESALRRSRATPPVSRASCRLETAAQRSGSPFGSGGPPVYACTLARGATSSAYDVQLLPTGCFVAERRSPGVAIYGCGAGRR